MPSLFRLIVLELFEHVFEYLMTIIPPPTLPRAMLFSLSGLSAVGSEVAAVIQLTLGELAAVEVTLGELEVLMKIPLVVEEEDLLTVGQIRKMNVVIIRLEMVE